MTKKQIKNKVREILEVYPETRDSDKLLYLKYFDQIGLHLTDSQKELILTIPAFETLRRYRQKFQELGQYKATEGIRHKRKQAEKEWKAEMKPIYKFDSDRQVFVQS